MGSQGQMDHCNAIKCDSGLSTPQNHNHHIITMTAMRDSNSHFELVKQALNVKVTVFFISKIKMLQSLGKKERDRSEELK
jgi:hypothetical protein